MDTRDETTAVPTTDDTPQSGGQVMDIQPPKSISVTGDGDIQDASSENAQSPAAEDSTSIPSALSAEPTPTTAQSDTSSSVEDMTLSEPAPEGPVNEPTPLSESPKPDASADPSTTAAHPEPVASPEPGNPHQDNPLAIHPDAHHGGTPLVAIIIAILVALALAGGVIFAYSKSKNNTKPSTATNTTTQTVAKPQANASDVDNTDKELDTSLSKANDATDFPDTQLSDTTLGL